MAEPSEWHRRYQSELKTYESCAVKLENLVRDLLLEAEIDVVAIESRAKDPESLQRKVDAKRDAYPEPLVDVTDLIGVRVIAYYLEDVKEISQILQREFVVDPHDSADKLDELEPDRFGYRSVHYIVSLSDSRAALIEWGAFAGKKAEIQVRTATQHAWAAVEHKLSYKRAREAPRDLRRRLMRLSALFELADEEFSGVRRQLGEVEAQYSDDLKGGNLELPVDKASLEAFIADSDILAARVAEAVKAGADIASPTTDGYDDRLNKDLGDLVVLLDRVGIETIAELEAALNKRAGIEKGLACLGSPELRAFRWRSPVDLLTILLVLQQPNWRELAVSIYHPGTVDALQSAMRNFETASRAGG